MAKEPKEPLFESLEQDIAKLKEEQDNGEVRPGRETDGNLSKQESESDRSARERISSRRSARKPAPSPQDKGDASQKDGGNARGPLGDSPRRGEGAPEDGGAPLGDGGASSGSGDDRGEVLEDEKPLTPQEEAYHRRVARENAAKIKELETKLAELSKPAPAVEPSKAEAKPAAQSETLDQWRTRNPEPDKEKDLAGWLVWNAEDGRKWREEQNASYTKTQEEKKFETLVTSAKQEIEQIQDEYKKKNPDYDNAIAFAKQEYTGALKKLMPQLSAAQVNQAIEKEIFNLALKCNKEGTNLGEVLYDMAIERFGYEAGNKPSASNPSLRPSLRVVSNNKRRSASPLAGGGEGAKGRISVEQASQMSPEELLGLDASDWEYLNQQGFN